MVRPVTPHRVAAVRFFVIAQNVTEDDRLPLIAWKFRDRFRKTSQGKVTFLRWGRSKRVRHADKEFVIGRQLGVLSIWHRYLIRVGSRFLP